MTEIAAVQNSKFSALRFIALICLGIAISVIGGFLVDMVANFIPHQGSIVRYVGGWAVGVVALIFAAIPLFKLFGVIPHRGRKHEEQDSR